MSTPRAPNIDDRVILPSDDRVLRVFAIESTAEDGLVVRLYEWSRKHRGYVETVPLDHLTHDPSAGLWRSS